MSGGLLEIGGVVLTRAQQRLETISQNIANQSTPGFKSQGVFESAVTVDSLDQQHAAPQPGFTDFSQAALRMTGLPFDLAISGPGFFRVRSADGEMYLTRDGQFALSADGLLKNTQGMVLQAAGGGDIVVTEPAAEILQDGLILEGGLPSGRVGIFSLSEGKVPAVVSGSLFKTDASLMDVVSPDVRQGMLEAANVQMATEMVTMMEALRSAEIGSRIIQTYDGLINSSITTFGKSA